MNWTKGWRDRAWADLDQDWDVIIIGGGITGAGILRQAIQSGLRVLLVEGDDFASGTSSRSSKLVHGGLRYLKNAHIKLTLESVREREYLLKQGRGLVNRLGFLYVTLRGDHIPGAIFGLGLSVYDLMARQWTHRAYDDLDMCELCHPLTTPDLRGGFRYFDAQADDARLVLRLLGEAVAAGALALNYTRVENLLRSKDGRVCGVTLQDTSGETVRTAQARSRVVINATGAWADALRAQVGKAPRLRPLRGSHLVIPYKRLPLTRAVTFLHPRDGRPVFAIPWEGVIIFGTTDVDHKSNLQSDPSISGDEFEYLLQALQHVFPGQELMPQDVMATFSGLRPVVNTGKADPSKESREHVIWEEAGLLTVSGGKLTTFRLMARDALRAARKQIGELQFEQEIPVLDVTPPDVEALLAQSSISPNQRMRLLGRYGRRAAQIVNPGNPDDLEFIPETPYLWAELRHAARAEGVIHLDDLLLRRIRLGILCHNGGLDLIDRIRAITQPELGWDETRWQAEIEAYARLWRESYCLNE